MNTSLPFVAQSAIVPSEEMGTILEASRYVQEAKGIFQRAQTDLHSASQQGREQGYRDGYNEGRRAALEDLGRAIEEMRAKLLTSEEELVGIVMSAMQRILGEMDDDSIARHCVKRALQDAADSAWVELRVAPEDMPIFAHFLEQIAMEAGSIEIRALHADPLLKDGEMILDTPKGRVHIGLRQQLARLQNGLGRV
jgi:type III secretion protein L